MVWFNRDEKCLLRGKNWVFGQSRLRFVFKSLSNAHTKLHAQFSEIKPNTVCAVNYIPYTLLASKHGLT